MITCKGNRLDCNRLVFAVDFHFVDMIPQDGESSASDVDGRLEGGYRNVPTSDKKMLTLGKPSW